MMYSSSLSVLFEEKYGMVKFVFWIHIIANQFLRSVFLGRGYLIFLVLWLLRFFAGGAQHQEDCLLQWRNLGSTLFDVRRFSPHFSFL